MQESPVRAEARHHPHPLRPEEVCLCVCVCGWAGGAQGAKGSMNVKRRSKGRMGTGLVRKRGTQSG